ncbi:MAG: long-chain fatty acid--CoA ligase [Chloroflexaceae bacterium]|nr:long-chain fatty acid--CoA ligase [Chloroflexaceae bacterium]
MAMPWHAFYEESVPLTITYPEKPLDTMLTDAARRYPQNRAMSLVLSYAAGGHLMVGSRTSYAKLDEQVSRMATALYQIGVRKGGRVGLMLPNCPQFVIAFFAIVRLGAVVVNINPTYTSRELGIQLHDSGTETIILLNLFWPRLCEIQTETPIKRVIVTYLHEMLPFPLDLLVSSRQRREKDWVTVHPEHDIFFFKRLLKTYGPTPPKVDIRPDDVALFQYTGGTTGTPKAAMLTHFNMLANTIQIAAWFTGKEEAREKIMAAIPFFHVYGLTAGILLTTGIAGEMVMVPTPRQIAHVMQVLQKERCTFFPGVPAMYISIVNHRRVQHYDLGSVRACLSGSAPLPMEIQEKFDALTGGRLVEGYGLTEAAPVTHCNPIHGLRKAGSIGIPFPDVEARLVDLETGEELPIGSDAVGELCLRGPQVMKGYWNRPDETSATIDEAGWLHTGDICKTDQDGYFYIVDRKKDMIITQGFKVLPRDVEEVLFMHPKVQEAVVVGYPLPTRGDEIVKAYIVPLPGSNPTVREIKDFCKLHLAAYKLPRKIEFRSELPRTVVGKVLRRVLVDEERERVQARLAKGGGEEPGNGENGEEDEE